jgi:mono/diheme cytochrome c family protein
MRLIIATVLVSVIIVYSSPFGMTADAAAGKAAFAKKCASCHGPEGEGNQKIATLLKVELRHLGSKEVQAKSDAELKKILLEGTGKMKPVKDLDAKSADDVVAHVRSLAKK